MNIPKLVEEKKRYFGTYTVMALMNAQTVLNHIQKVTELPIIPAINKEGKEFTPSDENLWQHPVMRYIWHVSYKQDDQPEKNQAVIEKLLHYFPFLKIMGENQRKYFNNKNNTNRLEVNSTDLHTVLNVMFKVIKKYRDTTTHYMTNDKCWDDGSDFLEKEQRLAIMIDSYYEVALRDLKERYSYTTDDLRFIQDYRYKRVRMPDGKPVMRKDTNFYLSMVDYNGDAGKKLHLSGVGVAQLVCLFLDKQYINQLVSNLKLTSKHLPSSQEAQIIRRSLGIHNIVLPKDRIRSDKGDMSIAMDMLGEIKRCPNELFDTLSADRQSSFRQISSDHNEVLLKRSSDRFAQLTLQYIDYGEKFDRIRFHVNMGKLRYLFNAEKTCVDGQVRVRVIEHPLNGFGRMAEMEAMRKQEDGTFGKTGIQIRDFDNVKRDDANPANYPYIVDTYTHYMLDDNHVEMLIGKPMDMPEIEEYDGKWYVNKTVPSCRMSTLELPAMMFHMHLLGSKRTESRIIDIYERYCKLFAALKQGAVSKENIGEFGIKEQDMPQKVLDVINGNAQGKNANEYILKTLQELYDHACKRIDNLRQDKRAIGSADNKMGKRGYRQIKPGKLAEYLIQDIVRWQPTLSAGDDYGTDRLTGLNYRVMQAAIATYDSHGEDEEARRFKAMFERANLIGGDRQKNHPFLYKVFGYRLPADIVDFYEKYLNEQKYYINSLLKKAKQGEVVNVPFVNRDQSKWKKPTQEYLGAEYMADKAIELPRQMFDEDIKNHLKTLDQMKDVDFDHANVTYLIGEYMKRVRDDAFQEFYAWRRNYRYIDLLKCEVDRTKRIPKLVETWTTTEEREKIWKEREKLAKEYRFWADGQMRNNPQTRKLTEDERGEIIAKRLSNSRNDYQKSEKMIRRYKVQDALLFIVANDTLTQYMDFNGKQFKLKDITPDAERGILSEKMSMDFKFEENGKTYIIYAQEMKIKNYGDFFVLANDKRLVNLLALVNQDRVSKDEIEQELKRYDVCRPEVVKMILDLEEWAFDNFPELEAKVMYDREDNKVDFKYILDVLLENKRIGEAQKETLRLIRNAFDHNNYPRPGVVNVVTLPEIAEEMRDLFGEYARIE